jgi:hypothetical protein
LHDSPFRGQVPPHAGASANFGIRSGAADILPAGRINVDSAGFIKLPNRARIFERQAYGQGSHVLFVEQGGNRELDKRASSAKI